MRVQVREEQLAIDQAMPFDLFDAHGFLLWPAGQVLSQRALEAKRGRTTEGMYREVEQRQLQVGDVMHDAVYDEQGVLLLGAGHAVTQRALDQMFLRGVSAGPDDNPASPASPQRPDTSADRLADPGGEEAAGGEDDRSEPEPLHTPTTRRLDRIIAAGDCQAPAAHIAGATAARMTPAQLLEASERVGKVRSETVEHYADLADDLLGGRAVHLGKTRSIVEGIVGTAKQDPSLCLLNLRAPSLVKEYIYDHGTNVMLLGVCMAQHLGYEEQAIHELGVGAMLQDMGMIRVPQDVRFAPRRLNSVEWVEVQRHPIHTVDLLEKARNAPAKSMLIAYQAHERCDRSGYPRGKDKASILAPARLIGVADTFVALTSPRPHRPALKPYDAMVAVLKEAHRGRLDAASVRALLDCLSLFPVGSFVHLSDGQQARVIRPNPACHTRPVVQPVNERGEMVGEAIDLAEDEELSVIAALDGPGSLSTADIAEAAIRCQGMAV